MRTCGGADLGRAAHSLIATYLQSGRARDGWWHRPFGVDYSISRTRIAAARTFADR